MNREIKFRAWHKEDKKMFTVEEPEWQDQGKREYYPFIVYYGYSSYDPEDFILMQYTELNDKNGVEIYEGDIIEVKGVKRPTGFGAHYEDMKYKITMNFGKWYCEKIEEKEQHQYYYNETLYDLYKHCKVIGNIYEGEKDE